MDTLAVLPLNGKANSNHDIAAHLREQADLIEQGAMGELQGVMTLFENAEGHLSRSNVGKHSDAARTVGILTFAIHLIMTGTI